MFHVLEYIAANVTRHARCDLRGKIANDDGGNTGEQSQQDHPSASGEDVVVLKLFRIHAERFILITHGVHACLHDHRIAQRGKLLIH